MCMFGKFKDEQKVLAIELADFHGFGAAQVPGCGALGARALGPLFPFLPLDPGANHVELPS